MTISLAERASVTRQSLINAALRYPATGNQASSLSRIPQQVFVNAPRQQVNKNTHEDVALIEQTISRTNNNCTQKQESSLEPDSVKARSYGEYRFFFRNISDVPHDGYAYLLKIEQKNEVVKYMDGQYFMFDGNSKDYYPMSAKVTLRTLKEYQ